MAFCPLHKQRWSSLAKPRIVSGLTPASERFSPDTHTPSISSISGFMWNSASVVWWNTATWWFSVDSLTGWYQCSFGGSSEVRLSTDRLDHRRVGKITQYSFSVGGRFEIGSETEQLFCFCFFLFLERKSFCMAVLFFFSPELRIFLFFYFLSCSLLHESDR